MGGINIEGLLFEINSRLQKNDKRDLFELIKNNECINKMDLHRVEIVNKEIKNILFSQNSFRGSFIINSVFFNCSFENCSFLTAIIDNSKFINCNFKNCVFYAASIENNVEENCIFINCYTELRAWDTLNNLLWLYEHSS